jgi:hypothetical protein
VRQYRVISAAWRCTELREKLEERGFSLLYSNLADYQEYFLGVKAAGAYG